jgi:Divergent InlB B-repeat domain
MRWLLIAAATAGLLFGVAGTASAAGPTWLTGQIIEPTANASINGLSCPTYTTCLAAASNIPVVQDNGPSYEPDPDPDPTGVLNAVSCAAGTDFCMFVDDSGGAFSYSNGNFGSLADIDGNIGIESASCPSSVFCMAIDDNNKVFKYSNGAWDGGTQLSTGAHAFNMTFVNVSCVSSSFCIALANTSDGELYYTWNGTMWSSAGGPFDASGGHTISLSCTSTTFCLETDEAGFASVFSGSAWSTPQHVDNPQGIANPILHSACVGTNCVGVDNYDNFIQTSDGTTWTSAVNIGADTGLTGNGINSIACATPTLCVVGDTEGDASTYAIPPNPTRPTLTGSPTVGQTLALTHATVQNPPVWYHDDWFRCANPGVTCTIDPISTSTSSYTLVAADAGAYIDARESVGFGFDIEGFLAGDQLVSNIVGPISTGGTTGGGGGGTSHTLAVTKNGAGSGTVASAPAGINCGAACSAGFTSGTQVTLTATAAGGSTFAGWSGGGCSGTGTCVVTLNSDQTITATFATIPPPLARCTLKAVSNKVHLKKKPATLSLKASCDQAASGTVTGTLKIVTKQKGKKKTKTFHLSTAHVSLTTGGTSPVVTVKLPAAAVNALKLRAKESATFTLTAKNANGTVSATATISSLGGV